MTLLGRFFGSRDDVPDWAKFFSPDDYRAFLAAVDDEMRRRQLSFELGEGTVQVSPPGADPADYGLLNLAQTCHATERSEWASTIREHFDNAFRSSRDSEELDAKAGSLDAIRSFLKVRLYHTDYRDQMGDQGLVHREPAEGLVETLVYDLPGSVRTVPPDHVERWSISKEELFKIGLANVKTERPAPARRTFAVGKGVGLEALVGDSFFTASHVLFLEDHLRPLPPYGAVVAVPHRHAVLFHPIADLRVMEAVNSMIPIAYGMYQDGPGSLSTELYWWRPGSLTALPSKVTATSISFSPPTAFVEEVLNKVPEPDEEKPE